MNKIRAWLGMGFASLAGSCLVEASQTAGSLAPGFLRDRGEGVATSLFATYVQEDEWLVYPFIEYGRNSAEEYHGSELGYAGETDYLGKSTEQETVLFLGYGIGPDLAIELEVEAYQRVTLERAADDITTGMPPEIRESGLGAVEMQLRWRFARETERAPEWFANLEIEFPFQRDKILIGSSEWEFGLGLGVTKGFDWGTLTARASLLYQRGEGSVEPGEYALEYCRRISSAWRVAMALEGEDSDLSAISELQWHFGPRACAKFNVGTGLTEKAADFAPEIGVVFSF